MKISQIVEGIESKYAVKESFGGNYEDRSKYVVDVETGEVVDGPFERYSEIPLRLMGYDGAHKVVSGAQLNGRGDDEELDEGWKDIVAGGALAASMAFGGMGGAHAQEAPRDVPAATQQAPAKTGIGAYTAGVESPAPYVISYKGKEYKFAGLGEDIPQGVKGETVTVGAGYIRMRSMKPVQVLLGNNGMYYHQPQ